MQPTSNTITISLDHKGKTIALNGGLYLPLSIPSTFYGRFSTVKVAIEDAEYNARLVDVSEKCLLKVPEAYCKKKNLQVGDFISIRLYLRPYRIPQATAELSQFFAAQGVALNQMSTQEMRQAVSFITEASDPNIRLMRMNYLLQAIQRRMPPAA
jgi:hypothetical protein